MIIIFFCTVDYYSCFCRREQVTGESGRKGRETNGRKRREGGSKGTDIRGRVKQWSKLQIQNLCDGEERIVTDQVTVIGYYSRKLLVQLYHIITEQRHSANYLTQHNRTLFQPRLSYYSNGIILCNLRFT